MEVNDYLYEVEYYEGKPFYFKYIVSKKYLVESLILPENEFLKSELSLRTSCLVKLSKDKIVSTDFNNLRTFVSEKDFLKLNIDPIENIIIHYLMHIKSIHNFEKIIEFAENKNAFYLKYYKIHSVIQLVNLNERNPELKYEIDNLRLRRDKLISIINRFKFLIKDFEKTLFLNEDDLNIIYLLKKDFK